MERNVTGSSHAEWTRRLPQKHLMKAENKVQQYRLTREAILFSEIHPDNSYVKISLSRVINISQTSQTADQALQAPRWLFLHMMFLMLHELCQAPLLRKPL